MRDLSKGYHMKEEYVNAFLAPAKLVWEKELNTPLNLVKAEAVSHQYTTEDITAIIGVSGSLRGNVLYGFANGSAFSVAGAMIGEPVTELDDMSLSALGEIASHYDDSYTRIRRTQVADEFVPVVAGHLDVSDHHIRRCRFELVQRLSSIACYLDLISLDFKVFGQLRADVQLVVHDQNSPNHRLLLWPDCTPGHFWPVTV